MSKTEHTASEKFAILQQIESGHMGVKSSARTFGISKTNC